MKARSLPFLPKKQILSAFFGGYKSAFRGSGVEIGNIREFDPSDDAKYIDWRSSAKGNKLFVKQFEESRCVRFLFFLDAGVNMRLALGDTSKSQYLSDLFSLLSFSALSAHDLVGGGVFTDTLSSFIEAKSGLGGISFLQNAHKNTLSQSHSFSSWQPVIDFLYARQVRKHVIIIISDSFSLASNTKLKTLAAKNDVICIHLLDNKEINGDFSRSTTFCSNMTSWVQSSFGITQNKHKNKMLTLIEWEQKALRQIGVSPLLLTTQDDMVARLFRFFKTRQ